MLKVLEDWRGYSAPSEVKRPEGYEMQLKEVIDLLTNAQGLPRHRHEFLLREVMTTSDFPLLFADVLDRQVLASYKAVDPVWKKFVRLSTVPRIFPEIGGRRFAITGGDQLLAEVPQKGEYPASSRDEAQYLIYVKKYGRQFDISWEALINDDLGALTDTPTRFSMAAVRTEHRVVTTIYANDIGTHAAGNLYDNATAGQINAVNVPLTIGNLENGVEAVQAFRDAAGEPIMNKPKFLVVPPALEFTARQILTSATKMWVTGATDFAALPSTPYPMTNVIADYGLQLVIDPYLAIINAATYPLSWYLFAAPSDIAAIEAAHLKGHERPEICMKASDKVSVGGAEVGPLSGDFATDNVFYRVRLVFGAAKLDWRATYVGYSAT
jgi:hypothetical protein